MSSTLMLRHIALTLCLLIINCGRNTPRPGTQDPTKPPVETPTVLSGVGYRVLNQGSLVSTDASVSGSGSILVTAPLREEDNNFALEFSLAAGGSLTLVANAENDLSKGVSLTFKRTNENTLSLSLVVGSETYDFAADYPDELAAYSTSAMIAVSTDIHGHGDLIPVVGTEKLGAQFKTRVAGRAWGLILNNANVKKMEQRKPLFPH